MKRLFVILLSLFIIGGATNIEAQSWLKKLGKKVENAAKNAVERNAERKTEKIVDDVFDGNINLPEGQSVDSSQSDDNSYDDSSSQSGQSGQQKGQSLEMTYAKSDFVPGDEILFEDNMANEQVGEFPSMWELHRGNAEIATLNGEKVICLVGKDGGWIEPLMKTPKNYLGDVFTVEFDVFIPNNPTGSFEVNFIPPTGDLKNDEVFYLYFNFHKLKGDMQPFEYTWRNRSGEKSNGNESASIVLDDWSRIAFSFNKRALKVYVNGLRIANVPNVKEAPGWVTFFGSSGMDKFIRNVRIAKGAVPLYDRMMSDGKFITYGITFDVGKSTIKPESMGEINRIVQLMTENPDLKFSVEGHTDNTGNPNSNQTLSEARSQAIVAKLVELGIASDRLTAVGKGQNSPIADNNTDEGRAKNRRVEFVKQ